MATAERTMGTTWEGGLAQASIVSSALVVHGRVRGLDAHGFRTAVDETAALCPISRRVAGGTIMASSDLEPM